MIHRTSLAAHPARPAAGSRRWAGLVGVVWLLSVAARPAWSQQYRVLVHPHPDAGSNASPARDAPRLPRQTVTVDLESYVEGALAGEASVLRNRAALQAMAVLARTWALCHRGRHSAEGFDFCALTHCQVFRLPGGRAGRYPPAIAEAARSTRHLVLEYRGRLADPYFTADCGGVTESAADLWPDRALPYLARTQDPYCAASEHSSWRRRMPLDRVSLILRDEPGVPIRGPVRDLTVASRDLSGRARTLELTADGRFTIDADEFRHAAGRRFGWDTLKSNLYTVERQGDTLVFTGRGLGHGVGLCQAGADAMAGLGVDYRQILAHYFPGTVVRNLGAAPVRATDPVATSEHFELDYPEAQQPWVSRTLSQLESWRRALPAPAGRGAARTRVVTWNTTAEFIRATGEPGWASGSSDAHAIFLQPLATLAARRILDSTLRHELTHLTLRQLRAPSVPVWFEEGMVMYLTGERIELGTPPAAGGRTLGEELARARSEAEMRAAYGRADQLVRGLAERRGAKALWHVLEHPSPEDLEWLRREEAKPLAP